MSLESVLSEIDRSFESAQVAWLERLVNLPSFTRAPEDVEVAAGSIEETLRELDMKVDRIPAEGFADHRVYSTPATGQENTALLVAGHCDTVYPREQGFLTFERDGDTIRGPGVLDMKSGLSVIVFALRALHCAAPEVFQNLKLRFACNTDEEVGSPDSRPMYESLASKTSAALVFEGGRDGDQIITCRKGTGGYRLEVQGRGAHAGNQHADGINAIHALALIIPRLEALTDYEEGTTLNVGTIRGGNSKNTVPGKAEVEIDVRITSMQAGEKLERAIQAIVESPFENLPGVPDRFSEVKVSLTGGFRRPPMESTEASEKLRIQYESAAREERLGTGEAPLQGGGSDANLLAAKGIPCIDGLGPYGKFMHSPREWSSLNSLRLRTRALARFLWDWEK